MTDTTAIRERILNEPDVILGDPDVMRALVDAGDRAMGVNVVDLRGAAMARLSERLDLLEDAHRSVIAAAYDNISGTDQIHRAVLRLLEEPDFEGIVAALGGDVAEILQVPALRLVLEAADGAAPGALPPTLAVVARGVVTDHLASGRAAPARVVTLRTLPGGGDPAIYGGDARRVRSEACLQLDLGTDGPAAMLVFGSADPLQFAPSQGTDLLAFLAGALERSLRRWL